MSKIDLWMAVKLAHNKAFNFMESVYVCVQSGGSNGVKEKNGFQQPTGWLECHIASGWDHLFFVVLPPWHHLDFSFSFSLEKKRLGFTSTWLPDKTCTTSEHTNC